MALQLMEDDDFINPTNLLDFDNETIVEQPPIDLNIKFANYWQILTANNFEETKLKAHLETISRDEQKSFFKFAINCLATFVQVNFTGPPLNQETETFLKESVGITENDARELLSINNEEINVNCRHCYLLLAAESVFTCCIITFMLNAWWLIRALFIHQKVLEDLSPKILLQIETLQKKVKDVEITNRNLHALYLIEQGQIFCEYRSVPKADDYIKEAYQIVGLKYKLFGRMGKRTKFQEKNIAQLTLEVFFDDNPEIVRKDVVDGLVVPYNIALNDDVRLDVVEFDNSNVADDENRLQTFPNLEQKVLLLVSMHMLISKPLDDLFYEQLKPFIDIILTQNNTWCVRTATLLLRCKLEDSHKRTIERSLMQAEEIVKSVDMEVPHVLNRVGGVVSTGLGPIWYMKQRYADLMLNLGMIKSALQTFREIQLWEEVIVCYTILGKRDKAEEIIRKQLEVKPTVKLYCLLGDATDDEFYYEKAWEFSKKRSHRAQRHWGNYFYNKKKYTECIPHFEKSLSINPLQAMVWLKLGYAALKTEKWQNAATAYRRFTAIEPNSFDAWNNLAQAYLKLGNDQNAYYALQDALRCSYDNWKVWDNYLVVCSQIKRWHDFIRAYHKVLDLTKEKYLKLHELERLVLQLLQDPENQDESSDLKKRTKELLGRISSLYPNEGGLWEIYAYLADNPALEVNRLAKSFRGYTQLNNNWFSDPTTSIRVLRVCQRMAEIALNRRSKLDMMTTNSIRLNISSAISATKSSQEFKEVTDFLPDVMNLLAQVIDKCKSFQGAATSQDKTES